MQIRGEVLHPCNPIFFAMIMRGEEGICTGCELIGGIRYIGETSADMMVKINLRAK